MANIVISALEPGVWGWLLVRYQGFDVAMRWACVVLLTQPISVRRAMEELHQRNSEVEIVYEVSLSVWISLEPSIKGTRMDVSHGQDAAA